MSTKVVGINTVDRGASQTTRSLWSVGMVAFCILGSAFAQNKAIDFRKGMPFSEGYVAGNTLYVAGQQGPDSQGKVTGTDITLQTTNTIAAIEKVVRKAGFQMTDITSVTVYVIDLNDVPKMNEVYKKLMLSVEPTLSSCTARTPTPPGTPPTSGMNCWRGATISPGRRDYRACSRS